MEGVSARSRWVYSCCGLDSTCSVEPCSTTLPSGLSFPQVDVSGSDVVGEP